MVMTKKEYKEIYDFLYNEGWIGSSISTKTFYKKEISMLLSKYASIKTKELKEEKIPKPNAAQIMSMFLWNKEVPKLKVKFKEDGTFKIEEESIVGFLFAYNEFLEYILSQNKQDENN